MHARDKRAAHASGTHVGERTAKRNDNGYGYCGPLETWYRAARRIARRKRNDRGPVLYQANTPGSCSPGLSRVILRGISPPPKFRISSSWNNDPGLLSVNPSLASDCTACPGLFISRFVYESLGRFAIEFSLIKVHIKFK